MDIVTDLTSQAVSFLTLLQDISKDKGIVSSKRSAEGYLPALKNEMTFFKRYAGREISPAEETPDDQYKLEEKRVKRIREILFSTLDPAEADRKMTVLFFEISEDLLDWLEEWRVKNIISSGEDVYRGTSALLLSPDEWRRNIRAILYENPGERIRLAKMIHYMPALIILALGEKSNGRQRIFQVFNEGHDDPLLKKEDNDRAGKWWLGFTNPNSPDQTRLQLAKQLISHEDELLAMLINDNPISFEMGFNRELDRIEETRKKRLEDPGSAEVVSDGYEEADRSRSKNKFYLRDHIQSPKPSGGSKDPLKRAEEMQLTALAFSGGGIRSATFNLGVIQKLAEKGILHHIDYLSTVSGGGYIGSWLLSWIYRSGSISKVISRLDTRKSTDPMADEVRPLRWLRMYSNYLSPNASIMSADAWTIGITWIRNTLINQFILLILLCAVLSGVEMVYKLWEWLAVDVTYNQWPTTLCASVMLIIGAALAGYGMRSFDKEIPSKMLQNYGRNRLLALYLVGWAMVSAFLLSTWLYKVTDDKYDADSKLWILIIPAVVALGSLIAIAYVGNYQKNLRFQKYKRFKNWVAALPLIVISSLAAIGVTFYLLFKVWEFYETLADSAECNCSDDWLVKLSRIIDARTLAFTFGLPIVLEVMSLGVVVRMFIMGIFFTDERREWWGRTGAVLHRFILIWILMTISVFILPRLVDKIGQAEIDSFVGLLGGWMAIVGAGVKIAFGSTTSGENKDKSGLSAKELFVRFVPYLFMIGFLLIGSATLHALQKINTWVPPSRFAGFGLALSETVILALITALLAWRSGVNEFTLHHFYRNRLVRAYLGATRRRTDRIQTANGFTGFDSKDDIGLSEFSKPGYYGPYPLINTALNATTVSELDRQDRKAESFLFSPLFCGFDFSATRAAAYDQNGISNYGYRITSEFAGAPSLGTAMAISGAAVNPNMGYHSSAATAFLLSVFNVKLGWWIGNPRMEKWKNPEPVSGLAYLVSDLIGKSGMDSNYVSLSDGGHFDNMGLYELVRRRCALIILSDAEEDNDSLCEGLAMAVRRCRIDFGVEIEIDTSPITSKDATTNLCASHIVEGVIRYPGNVKPGKLIYIKTALTGDEPADIREYKMQNPLFPQQPTSDQFFTEDQFESYRKLGYHSVK